MYSYDVSIIVSAYNEEKYIEECLNSIISQTFSFNRIEVIVINDGSNDNTKEILQKHNKYENIIIVNQPNMGVSASRNNGIMQARGKYIMMLDGDDYISKISVEKLYNFMENNYDLIDICAYKLLVDKEDKIIKHVRSDVYKKGTGIYDVNEYFNISQATVNIIFKNNFENNITYNTSMKVAEDNDFNIRLIMKKQTIGYCEEATYYYRRHNLNTSKQLRNLLNNYEPVMVFHERLIKEYKKSDKLPRYIQGVILFSLSNRIKVDIVFPYHYIYQYGIERYDLEIKRLKNILNNIESEVLFSDNNLNDFHKLFVARLRDDSLSFNVSDKSELIIMHENREIAREKNINIQMRKLLIKDNQLIMNGYLKTRVSEFLKPELIINIKYHNGTSEEKHINLFDSAMSYYQSTIKTNTFYGFDDKIDIENIQQISFWINILDKKIPIRLSYSNYCIFNRKLKRLRIVNNNTLISSLDISKNNNTATLNFEKISKIKEYIIKLKESKKYNGEDKQFRKNIKNNKIIWLYFDSEKGIDNSFYQFVHDVKQKDNIKKYYVYFSNLDKIKEQLDSKYHSNLILFNSDEFKNKLLNANKVFLSDYDNKLISLEGNINRYGDLIKFDIYFLNNQIFNDQSIKKFAKSSTLIDYFVVSSLFEKEILIEKYNYNSEDILLTGMPKQIIKKAEIECEKKKILVNFSNRLYINNKLESSSSNDYHKIFNEFEYFNNIKSLLTSKKLSNFLIKHKLEMDFKLADEYRIFEDMFDNVNIVNDINELDYELLITDFSSIQFDFINKQKPIIYFLPDPIEFYAGMDYYRQYKIPCDYIHNIIYNSSDVIDNVIDFVNSNFKMNSELEKIAYNFYIRVNNPIEEIYKLVRKQ